MVPNFVRFMAPNSLSKYMGGGSTPVNTVLRPKKNLSGNENISDQLLPPWVMHRNRFHLSEGISAP